MTGDLEDIPRINPFMPQTRIENPREILIQKARTLLTRFGYGEFSGLAEGKIKELTDEQCRLILAELRL